MHYIDMDIVGSSGSKRTICFDQRRYAFNDLTTLKNNLKVCHNENDYIIITDHSKTTKIEVHYIEVKNSDKKCHESADSVIQVCRTTIIIKKSVYITFFRLIVVSLQIKIIYQLNHTYLGK